MPAANRGRLARSARWLPPCETGNRVLRITAGGESRDYEVAEGDGECALYRLDGLRMETLRVTFGMDGRRCNCPTGDVDPLWCDDCIHIGAMRAALGQLVGENCSTE